MAGLSDLATAFAIQGKIDPMIEESDPYSSFGKSFESITPSVLKLVTTPQNGKPASIKDALIAGASLGLLSGVAGGLSEDYKGRAREAYQDVFDQTLAGKTPEQPEVLSKKLFSSATTSGDLFKTLQAQEDAQNLNTLKQRTAAEMISRQVASGDLTAEQGQQALESVGRPAISSSSTSAEGKTPLQLRMDTYEIPEEDRKGILNNEQLERYLISKQSRQDRLDRQEDKLTEQSAKREDKLRSEWTNQTKGIDVISSIQREARRLAELDNPAADVALKELLQRDITPGASAVRAEFFRKIDDAANPLNKLKGAVQNWLGGGTTAPETRRQILATIETISSDKLHYYKTLADSKYRKIADSSGGKLSFDRIVPEYNDIFGSIQQESAPSDRNALLAEAKRRGLIK